VLRLLFRSSILVLAAPDNLLPEDFHLASFRQIHRLDDHHLQLLVGDGVTFQVEQEVVTFDIAAIGEIHPKVEFDAEFRAGIWFVHGH